MESNADTIWEAPSGLPDSLSTLSMDALAVSLLIFTKSFQIWTAVSHHDPGADESLSIPLTEKCWGQHPRLRKSYRLILPIRSPHHHQIRIFKCKSKN